MGNYLLLSYSLDVGNSFLDSSLFLVGRGFLNLIVDISTSFFSLGLHDFLLILLDANFMISLFCGNCNLEGSGGGLFNLFFSSLVELVIRIEL